MATIKFESYTDLLVEFTFPEARTLIDHLPPPHHHDPRSLSLFAPLTAFNCPLSNWSVAGI